MLSRPQSCAKKAPKSGHFTHKNGGLSSPEQLPFLLFTLSATHPKSHQNCKSKFLVFLWGRNGRKSGGGNLQITENGWGSNEENTVVFVHHGVHMQLMRLQSKQPLLVLCKHEKEGGGQSRYCIQLSLSLSLLPKEGGERGDTPLCFSNTGATSAVAR